MKISKLNYFEQYGKLPDSFKDESMIQAHDMLVKLTGNGANWTKVYSNTSFAKISENQFEALELALQESKASGKGTAKTKPSAGQKPKKGKSSSAKKSTTAPKAKSSAGGKSKIRLPKMKHGSPVETLDPHLKMLTRYRAMDSKTVPKERVIGLARALVKQIEARVLRKKSDHAQLIEQMKEQLFDFISKNKGAMISVNIPERTRNGITKAVSTEHKMVSVSLLNRYAGMAGKLTTLEKGKKLYNAMFNAIEKEAIPENDRYFERVIEVMKNLKEFVEQEDESKTLELLPAELSGLFGCGCQSDLQADETEGGDFDYPTYESSKSRPNTEPVSSTDFIKRQFPCYHIAEPWVRVFGHIEPGKHIVVYSKEKFGKTTALVEFAGYLSKSHGPVLFVEKEEELSGTFQDKFMRTRAANPNLDVVEDLPSDEVLRNYKFVFLDSISRLKLTPDQLLHLQNRITPTTLIAVLHATKDGKHRGANTYVQDASQIVEFPEFGVAFGKGRFKGCTGELVRFAEPKM